MSTTHEVTRMTGLMSGLDVESLVKAGTQSTKNSLDSKKQKLQTLQWKQEAYRDIIKAMNAFQSKYLDISSSSSIRANAVMKSNKATSSDSSLIVTAGSSAAAKDYTITAVKSAQAASVGGSRVSSGEVTLDFSRASEGENKVSVTLDGSARSITFTGGATAEESKQNFLDALNKSFGEISAAKFSFKDGTNKLTIENAPDDKVSHIFTVGYSDSVGLKNDASNMISTKATLGSIDFKTPLSPSGTYDFSINGKSFSFKSTTTVKDMMNEINRSDAGVKITFDELSQSFEMKSSQTGAGQQIKLEQKNGNLLNSLFNIDSGSLSVSPTSAKLVEKNISADTEFKFTAKAGGLASGDSISVNGVKLGITGLTQTQKTEKISVNGQDDVDAQLYTDKNGDTIYKYTQDNVVHYATKGDDGSFTDIATKENSTVTINGKQVEDLEGKTADAYINSQLGLEKQLNPKTSEQYEKALNDAYKNAVPDGKGSFSVTIENDEAKISFTPGADELAKITVSGDVAAEGSADGTIANYTETPYSADKVFSDKTSFELLVDNKDVVTINGTGENGKVTVQDLVDSGLFNYNETDGTLTVAGKKQIDAGYGDAVFDFDNAFGTAKLVGEESFGSYSVHGSNAQMTINGVTLESASNSFTVEGTSFSIGNVKDFDQNDIDSGKAEAITVGVTKDTSRIKETIKEFMTSYNALLDTVNKALNTSRPKSSSGDYYDPLTEDQENEMEQNEIDKWNEKAKEGLLYHDSTLTKVFTNLRTSVNAVVGGMSMHDLGITTSKNMDEYGKLEFRTDVDGEQMLDTAIEKYGDEIATFFTDLEKGFGTQINNAIKAATDTSTNSRGYPKGILTSVAGVANTRSAKMNTIYSQITSLQKVIEKLNTRYDNEKERLWSRYSSLETYITNMNMQSQSLFGTSLNGSAAQ